LPALLVMWLGAPLFGAPMRVPVCVLVPFDRRDVRPETRDGDRLEIRDVRPELRLTCRVERDTPRDDPMREPPLRTLRIPPPPPPRKPPPPPPRKPPPPPPRKPPPPPPWPRADEKSVMPSDTTDGACEFFFDD